MSAPQALSRPEKLLRLASWLVALVFAGFLIGLGDKIIGDLFYVGEGPPQRETLVKQAGKQALEKQQETLSKQSEALEKQREPISQTRSQLERTYDTQRQSLDNWLASRTATADANQSAEVLKRSKELDALQAQILAWQAKENQLSKQLLPLQQQQEVLQQKTEELDQLVETQYQPLYERYTFKIFLIRLAVILPLLLLAVWLFSRYRNHRYWCFVYGYGLAALFAFFVELVPYLPSYGGYVRWVVGIVLTAFAGIRMIQAFQRYAERKKQELQQSQNERAQHVAYAQARVAFQKKTCPSCDHHYNITGEDADYCIHCGLQLFRLCGCGARNFVFFPFCKKCGSETSAKQEAAAP